MAILALEAVRELPDFTPPHIPGNPSLRRGFERRLSALQVFR